MKILSERDPTLLEASDLCVGYGDHLVLRGVNLSIRRGEFWFVLGPNGSGKTSFLQTVLGEIPVASGRIELRAGHERLGFVPQRCEINPALPTTVREFVRLGAVGARVDAGALDRALGRVNLGGMARKDFWSLSGGQRQRALLARALIRRPAVLVLDEPTNGLDLPTEDALLRFLAGLHRDPRPEAFVGLDFLRGRGRPRLLRPQRRDEGHHGDERQDQAGNAHGRPPDGRP